MFFFIIIICTTEDVIIQGCSMTWIIVKSVSDNIYMEANSKRSTGVLWMKLFLSNVVDTRY